MSDTIEGTVTIRLEGQATDDDRIYVTSPDLWGFHFVLDRDDDPVETMEPALKVFIAQSLKAKMTALRVGMSPRD